MSNRCKQCGAAATSYINDVAVCGSRACISRSVLDATHAMHHALAQINPGFKKWLERDNDPGYKERLTRGNDAD